MKLLNNLPIEDLNPDNDYLGIIEKGDLIKLFLESNTSQFAEIKMFALYGEWGSGKSSLMKYLQKELSPNFNTFFFDTWEFETDNNLSLSLLEFLISESTSAGEEMAGELIGIAEKLLKGFTKSVRISFPGLSIEGKTLIEEMESEKEKTFLQLKKEFKKEFVRFEDKIKAQTEKEFNIVFIDDLDRCEPENVLNLLSALKLFFTYGEKTIFFCGVDKKAVTEAIRTKYNDIVKAEEYLEKIFDVNFTMPEPSNIDKLVSQFFDDRDVNEGQFKGRLDEKISEFFIKINFTNPRRLKKILNKYQTISVFKNLLKENATGKIPNIYIRNEDGGNFMETILTLYFLILQEFYLKKFTAFFNIEEKKLMYKKAVFNHYDGMNAANRTTEIERVNNFLIDGHHKIELYQFSRFKNSQDKTEKLMAFIKMFTPIKVEFLSYRAFGSLREFKQYFNLQEKEIDYLFVEYLFENADNILFNSDLGNFVIEEFKYLQLRFV